MIDDAKFLCFLGRHKLVSISDLLCIGKGGTWRVWGVIGDGGGVVQNRTGDELADLVHLYLMLFKCHTIILLFSSLVTAFLHDTSVVQ